MKRGGVGLAAACAAGVGLNFAGRERLRQKGFHSDCSLLDLSMVLWKGYEEGPHFLGGLGPGIDAILGAIAEMKRTPPRDIELRWKSPWEKRYSDLSRKDFWVRRGEFLSPIAECLPAESRMATVWEVRGSQPNDEDLAEAVASGDLLLPAATRWMGVPWVDRRVDKLVRLLNRRWSHTSDVPAPFPSDTGAGASQGIVVLPDFGGEHCKRSLPVGELVAAELPNASVMLLEMPLRGTRKPAGYVGSLMPTLEGMMAMGCGAIEESRALLQWQGYCRLTLAGISMGGHMAALTACCSPDVTRLALLLPAHSGEANWVDGGLLGLNNGMAREEMQPLLWEATNINAYPVPKSVQHALVVAARNDGYVPLWSSQIVADWLVANKVSSELRVIRGGHVSAFIAQQTTFAEALVEVARTG